LVRIKASRVGEPFEEVRNLTAEQIDEICLRVEQLAGIVWEFGTACTAQHAHDPARRYPKQRVREVLQIEGKDVVYRGGN
jgi:hypothetical protein